MGKLATAQTKLLARLLSDAFFFDPESPAPLPPEGGGEPSEPSVKVPVISKTRGDLAAAINEALAKSSVGLVVLFVGAKTEATDTHELVLRAQWAISAIENPAAKEESAPTAEDIVEKAAALLHWHPNGVSPNDESDAGRFTVAGDAIDPLDAANEKRPELAALNILVLTLNTTISLNT